MKNRGLIVERAGKRIAVSEMMVEYGVFVTMGDTLFSSQEAIKNWEEAVKNIGLAWALHRFFERDAENGKFNLDNS